MTVRRRTSTDSMVMRVLDLVHAAAIELRKAAVVVGDLDDRAGHQRDPLTNGEVAQVRRERLMYSVAAAVEKVDVRDDFGFHLVLVLIAYSGDSNGSTAPLQMSR